MRFVPVDSLQAGMILGRDIISNAKSFMLKRGITLTDSYIKYLQLNGYFGAYISDMTSEDVIFEEIIDHETVQKGIDAVASQNIGAIINVSADMVSQVSKKTDISVDLFDLRSFDDYTFHHSVNVAVYAAAVGKKMNLSEEAFYEMNKEHIISVEDAALGFALSVLHAAEYNGQEIGSLQVLNALAPKDGATVRVDAEVLGRVARTFSEQYRGWKERNVFERQWVLRDFRKCVGRPADEVQARMQELAQSGGLLAADDRGLFEALVRYWRRQHQLLQSFEKDPQKRQEHSRTIDGWIADLLSLLG